MRHQVTVALAQDLHQALVQARVAVIAEQGFGVGDGSGLVLPVNQVPGGQIKKHAAGHLALLGPQVPVAQQRHDLRQVQLPVVIGATNVHTRGGQNVRAAIGLLPALWPQAHHRKVRGTTPQVHHQHGALFRQALFVVQRGRNRFQLKRHLVKTHRLHGLAQGGFGLCIALRVVVHKMHGPAHHHAARCAAQVQCSAFTQSGQKGADDVLKTDLLVLDLRGLQEQRAAQQAFERAHQPAFSAFHVMPDGIPPKVGGLVFGVVEHGGGHGQGLALQRDQAGAAFGAEPGHGRVGGTEIDAECTDVGGHHEWGLSIRGAQAWAWDTCLETACFMDRAFCHQVRECPFTRKDESVRMRYRTDQRSIISKNVKNTFFLSGRRNFKQRCDQELGAITGQQPFGSKEFPSEQNKNRAGFLGHGCGLFSGCRHRHPVG